MEYVAGRSNLACTIFVPYDCKNNCPFCTSKAMYNHLSMNIATILDDIKAMNRVQCITEYVITGGEPIANLKILKTIVNACEKKVFINTTLPLQDNLEEVIEYFNYEPKIQGINISRHMAFDFKNVAPEETIRKIVKPIRINSVVTNTKDMMNFILKWAYIPDAKIMVNFRADYRKLTKESLKVRDEIDDWCLENFYYKGNNSCMVCNSELFGDNFMTFCYHRGLEKSSFTVGEKCYVNDVIIYPNGKITKDWGLENLDASFVDALFNNKIY